MYDFIYRSYVFFKRKFFVFFWLGVCFIVLIFWVYLCIINIYDYKFLILLLLKFYVVNKLGLKYIGYDKIEN